MVDIEPFKYQASTNIKEHNEIVDKVNEIVGVINDINLDGLDPRLTADEANIKKNTDDIAQLKISDNEHTTQITTLDSNVDNHAREITNLKASDVKQNSDITELNTLTDALTKELPTEITLYRDGTGKIKAQITKEDNTTFDSNTLDMVIPYQYSIISGTSARSFKLDITTSDGNHIITNDFLIPEGGGTDVTVTSVTLIKDPTNSNKVKVSIGLSDGTPLESGYVEMVNAVSGTFANNKLTITVNGVSSVPITIEGGGSGPTYTAGQGITINNNIISLASGYDQYISEVFLGNGSYEASTKTLTFFNYNDDPFTFVFDNLASLTDVDNKISPLDTKITNLQNATGDAFSQVAIGADYASFDFTALDGQVNNIKIPSNPIFSEHFTAFSEPSNIFASMKASIKVGNLVTVSSLGKTASSWSGSITGIVRNIGNTSIQLDFIGGNIWYNNEIVPIGMLNYNTQPTFLVSATDLHVYILKGNAIIGQSLAWSDSQGSSMIVYR